MKRKSVQKSKVSVDEVIRPAAQETGPKNTKSSWIVAAIIVLVAAIVYVRAFTFDFVSWDDSLNVYGNKYLASPSIANILYFWRHPYGYTYRPMAYTVWALIASVSRLPHPVDHPGVGEYSLNPAVFHAANILLHTMNSLMVFAIIRKLVRSEWAAGAGALLFTIHPFQANVVAWVTGMNEILFGAFSLAAIWLYLSSAEATVKGKSGAAAVQRRRGWLLYGMAAVCYILALFTKPTAIVVPLMIWNFDRMIFRRPWKQSAILLLPWIGLIIPAVWLTVGAKPIDVGGVHTSPWIRPFIAGDALAFYLAKLVCPYDFAPDYGRTPAFVMENGIGYVTWLVPALIGILIWRVKGRCPVPAAGMIAAVAGLVPVLGLVPNSFQFFSTVANHYMYLPMFGISITLAWIAWRITEQRSTRVYSAAGLALVFLCLGVRSAGSIQFWRNDTALMSHTLAVNPRSWMAENNLANVYLHENKTDKALALYMTAIKLRPNFAEANNNMGVTLAKIGRDSDAIAAYQRALDAKPDYADAANNMGNAYSHIGNSSSAISAYDDALAIDPGLPETHHALAVQLSKADRLTEAESEYRAALRIRPNYADAHNNLGIVLGRLGRHSDAISELKEVVRLDPSNAQAYNNLAFNQAGQGMLSEAEDNWNKALALKPDYVEAHLNLGLALAMRGQNPQAIAQYREVLRLNPDSVEAKAALARALAAR